MEDRGLHCVGEETPSLLQPCLLKAHDIRRELARGLAPSIVNLAWQSGQLPYSWFISSQAGDSGQPPVGNTGSSFLFDSCQRKTGGRNLGTGTGAEIPTWCLSACWITYHV